MELKPGYKQTEIGIIPEDWDVSTVGAEFDVKLGKMLDAEKNIGIPKPYLGNRAVQWSSIDITDLPTVPLTRTDLERYRLREGDLLVCEGGEVGRAAIWNAPIDECYYQKALHRLRPLHGFDPRVMVGLLHQYSAKGILANYVTQTSIAHLPRDKFMEIPIPVPPQTEQRAIAVALSDMDALLEGLERLIAKKCDLKQAAMQELLTGQTRLPGFTCEWTSSRFGMLASPRKQRVDPRRSSQSLYCIELEHIESGTGCLLSFGETISTSSQKSIFEKDDILFGRLRAYLKKYWLADRSGVCSTEIWVLEVNRALAAPFYLAQIVQLGDFIRAASSSYGTHMPRSDWNVVKEFELSMPELDEQNAVAEVLSSMDAEIAALEQRLAKTCDLKQAMMQELLTGKTRLAATEVVHA